LRVNVCSLEFVPERIGSGKGPYAYVRVGRQMRKRVGQEHFGAAQSQTLDNVDDARFGHENVNISLSAAAWAICVGIALGAAYAASPVTCWFLIAMMALFSWAGRGLSHRERWWVWRLLALAVVLGLLTIAVLFLKSDPRVLSSFPWERDGEGIALRSWWIRNVWMDIPILPQYFKSAADPYAWTTFLYVLAYVQYLLGIAPYGLHVINIGLSVATAIILYRLIRLSYGPEPALVGLTLMLFTPTLFLWSVSTLKEPIFVFVAAVTVTAAVAVVRGRSSLHRVLAVAILFACLWAIEGIRSGGRLVTGAGVVAGCAASVAARRAIAMLLATLLVLAGGVVLLKSSAIHARVRSELQLAAGKHLGHVNTEGHHYKLLDQRLYTIHRSLGAITGPEAARFVARALAAVVVFPLPWQAESRSELAFLPQQMLWYVLLAFAMVGFVAGLRRDALVTCTLAGVAAVGAAGIALNSGNFGTMVRHRDMIMPFVMCLSALGLVVVVSRLLSRVNDAAD
jgi:hypothetical protein